MVRTSQRVGITIGALLTAATLFTLAQIRHEVSFEVTALKERNFKVIVAIGADYTIIDPIKLGSVTYSRTAWPGEEATLVARPRDAQSFGDLYCAIRIDGQLAKEQKVRDGAECNIEAEVPLLTE